MNNVNDTAVSVSDVSITVELPVVVNMNSLRHMCIEAGVEPSFFSKMPVSFKPTSREEAAISKARLTLALANNRQNCSFADLFFDPAWIILLDLLVRENEGYKTSISSACVASFSPSTTALRHITEMVRRGILIRTPDPADSRRVFLTLGDQTRDELVTVLSKT